MTSLPPQAQPVRMPTHDSLLALATPPSERQGVLRTRKMRWWYEALADFMIANPSATQGEIAAYFGRAQATISVVVNTDAFKAYYRQRRAQHAEKLDTAVREKLFRVADSSLDRMLDVLDKKRDSIPLETLHKTADTALRNLGYGAGPSGGVQVNVSAPPQTVNVAVSLDDLERARAALRHSQMAPPVTIDADCADRRGAPDRTAPEGRGAPNCTPESACEAGSATTPSDEPNV